MIIRETAKGLTLIRQAEHARLCGVMAEAWGAGGFEAPQPREAVVLAAAEHDNGWKEWESTPRLNPETRRPFTYMDIPIDQHLAIYRRGIARALVLGAYAGLLVSLHGSLLYSRFRRGQPGATSFLAEQKALRERLTEELRRDPRYADHCDSEAVTANRDLLFGWDALSLFLCHGQAWEDHLDFPPSRGSERRPVGVEGGADRWTLQPYPFRGPLTLSIYVTEIAAKGFEDEGALRAALTAARSGQIDVTIEPA